MHLREDQPSVITGYYRYTDIKFEWSVLGGSAISEQLLTGIYRNKAVPEESAETVRQILGPDAHLEFQNRDFLMLYDRPLLSSPS